MTLPAPAGSQADRQADRVIRRFDQHAVAAVVEDEIRLDRVQRPIEQRTPAPRFPWITLRSTGLAPPIMLFELSIETPTPLALGLEAATTGLNVVGLNWDTPMKLPQTVSPSTPATVVAGGSRAIAAPREPGDDQAVDRAVRRGDRQAIDDATDPGAVDLDGDRRDIGLLGRRGRRSFPRSIVACGAGLAVAVDDDGGG